MSRNPKIIINDHETASGSRVSWLDKFADEKLSNTKTASVNHQRVDWLDRFADKIAKEDGKTAVQVARERSKSIYDEINHILNSSNKTVEGVVNQYREQTGLNQYLQRLSNSKDNTKVASSDVPSLDKFGPKMKSDILNTIRNNVEKNHGYCSVPAVLYDVAEIFGQNGLQNEDLSHEDDVTQYINDVISEVQMRNPLPDNSQQLGKGIIDEEDEDDSNFLSSIQGM